MLERLHAGDQVLLPRIPYQLFTPKGEFQVCLFKHRCPIISNDSVHNYHVHNCFSLLLHFVFYQGRLLMIKDKLDTHRRGLLSSASSSSTSSSQPYPRCLRKVVAYGSFPPSVPMLSLMSCALMEPLSSVAEDDTRQRTHTCW